MSADADRTTEIDVEVPTELLEAIDDEYADRGCPSRTEAIRDALRAWVDSPVRLSEEALEDLAESREQCERGATVSTADARDRLEFERRSADVEYTERALEQLEWLNSAIAEHLVDEIEAAVESAKRRPQPISGTPYYELRDSDWQAIFLRDRDSDRFVVAAVGHRQYVYDHPFRRAR